MKNSIWRRCGGRWGHNPLPGRLAPFASVENTLKSIKTEDKPSTRKIREDDFIVIPGELM